MSLCSQVSVPYMMSGRVADTDVLNVWILFLRLWKLITRFVTVLIKFWPCGGVPFELLGEGRVGFFGVEAP